MSITEKQISGFIEKLENEFIRLRAEIPNTSSTVEIIINEKFKRCLCINHCLSALLKIKDNDFLNDVFILIAEHDDFDIDKFLLRFDVDFITNENNKTLDYKVKFNDER